MLIDDFMPSYDVSEYHETSVRADIQTVYDALRTTDLGGSPVVRLLLRLRELPGILTRRRNKRNLKLNLDALIKSGFVLLGENVPNEIALGLVGRFWTLSGSTCRTDVDGFKEFDRPGYAKAVWNFSVIEQTAELTKLATETRVLCLDRRSKYRFRLYWVLVAPFSGLIRREALREIRRSSESGSEFRL